MKRIEVRYSPEQSHTQQLVVSQHYSLSQGIIKNKAQSVLDLTL